MSNARTSIVYILLAATAAAAVVIPSPKIDEPPARVDPIVVAKANAEWQLRLHSELLRRADSRAVAQAATARARTDEGAVTLVPGANSSEAIQDRIRVSVNAGLRTLPRRDTSVRVVVATVIDTGGPIAGARVTRAGYESSIDVFPPGTVSDNACAVVVRVHTRSWTRPMSTLQAERRRVSGDDMLGACWWYAAYGKPGPRIAQWLDSTHYGSITRSGLRVRGGWWEESWSQIPLVQACVYSPAVPCSAFVLRHVDRLRVDHVGLSPSPGWAGRGRTAQDARALLPASLFADLHRQLGAETFAELWRSADALPQVFETAAGMPLDQWVRRRLTQIVDAYREPPPVGTADDILPILLGVGLIAAGIHGVRRRPTLS